jgi:hypothetical protein
MLVTIGLVAAGFALGVALTSIAAAYVFGLLHAEAVRALESYGMFYMVPSRALPPEFHHDGA